MRAIPFSLAVLSLGCLVSGGSAQAQVNLLHPPHHVHITPKSTDQPASSSTAAPPASATPAPPAAPATAAAPAAPPQSAAAAPPPATPQL